MKTDLYELGTTPPVGVVPDQMYASVIRPDRYGEPRKAFRTEVVPVPPVGRGQVLVLIMAAGINYNNVWASLGQPVDVVAMRRRRLGETIGCHIGGSEASGVVWSLGEGVRQVAVGDHVIVSSVQWDESSSDIRLGADTVMSSSTMAWGYESNFGSFAQFAVVDEYQCHPKPAELGWAEAAAFMLTGPTAYRQLCGWHPNVVQPGDPVLIWGGAGGLGSMAIQITRLRGGVPVAVVSDDSRVEHCLRLGAAGTINRLEFGHWGRLPGVEDAVASDAWMTEARRFGAQIWDILGARLAPRIVLEHSGQATLPTSMFVCDTGGMVVICGGTSGFNGDVDLRYLWMRQKRLQGSHYANLRECRQVTTLVGQRRLDPCLTVCGTLGDVGTAHQLLYENRQPPGNLAVLVNAAPGSI
ncbi:MULTISPECIES: crotonyl-CoA carboxylase/reductase [unclassified Pseudofrankia]|uniref:crotonyl-CoA carboxylase/reductase n=1 Tax=unclassified Pseudofrankia TaxID=2994372 RepID=UPI0008DB0D48|nr:MULTISPECIES: crotonyl-CoA carboxylase/reductase [unclassified Pseudofrankia]MDT3439997.1 crotonyl-CoA carboxylase/reductase [Pseudofrankia sp. BMG5.37]OHV48452.1 crotonyl-CoA carboxylase/reductase [Pseudofrankia sp. BMG5.36]